MMFPLSWDYEQRRLSSRSNSGLNFAFFASSGLILSFPVYGIYGLEVAGRHSRERFEWNSAQHVGFRNSFFAAETGFFCSTFFFVGLFIFLSYSVCFFFRFAFCSVRFVYKFVFI